jgi:hypothetical protein
MNPANRFPRCRALIVSKSLVSWVLLVGALMIASPLPVKPAWALGEDWSIVPSKRPPGVLLEAAVAVSGHDVWAVGGSPDRGPIAAHWDGTEWTLVPTNVAGEARFMAVTAIASDDVWAAGFHAFDPIRSLIEHWDGVRWRFVSSPIEDVSDQALLGLYAASSRDVWAVGHRGGRPFTEHWNGRTWRVVPIPSPPIGGVLTSVSGASGGDIWAVGFRGPPNTSPPAGTLIEHWNGSAWSIVAAPGKSSPYALNSVAVIGADDIWAVGGQPRDPIAIFEGLHSISEHWDGSSWSDVPTSHHSRTDTLNAVTIAPNGDVWATGQLESSTGCSCPLAERWAATEWIDSLPLPLHDDDTLNGLAASRNWLWAVGYFVFGLNPVHPLIERRGLP